MCVACGGTMCVFDVCMCVCVTECICVSGCVACGYHVCVCVCATCGYHLCDVCVTRVCQYVCDVCVCVPVSRCLTLITKSASIERGALQTDMTIKREK